MDSNEYSVNVTAGYWIPWQVTARATNTWPDTALDYSTNLDSVYVGTATTNTTMYRNFKRVSIQVFGWKN
jgi:hypothetical protein